MTQRVFHGSPVSSGIIIGTAYSLDYKSLTLEPRPVPPERINAEIERFRSAVQLSKTQLSTIRSQVKDGVDERHAAIFDSHLLILEDPLIIDETIARIKKEHLNAEYVFNTTVEKIASMFEKIKDDYLSARKLDLYDVASRVINNLLHLESSKLSRLKEEVIVVAHDLGPSDTAHMVKEKVTSFVTDIGGPTSHTAIMAKALEIPAVVGLDNITKYVHSGDTLIVDGIKGVVVHNPTPEAEEDYRRAQQEFYEQERALASFRHLPAETLDSHIIGLCANIELAEEVDHVLRHGAEGIGLFRTEFIYLNQEHLPTEEEQFAVYRLVVEKMKPHPVVFRTLDVGGDKFLSSIPISKELNPFLGLRAIRLCLEYPDMFRQQLRAILRASGFGSARILFPLVSGRREVRAAKRIVEEVKQELATQKMAFDTNIQIGIMIEIPSAAVIADLLAREVDFFSIGTNDLIQYTLAVDRVNEKVAYLYDPLHPAILRLIQYIVEAAHRHGIWVSVCGEMAGEPAIAAILMGLGIDELSMGAVAIPEVKKTIRGIRLADARELINEIMTQSSMQDLRELVNQRVREMCRASDSATLSDGTSDEAV
jgi:phosphotransferase system enzyme I (PtsI)